MPTRTGIEQKCENFKSSRSPLDGASAHKPWCKLKVWRSFRWAQYSCRGRCFGLIGYSHSLSLITFPVCAPSRPSARSVFLTAKTWRERQWVSN